MDGQAHSKGEGMDGLGKERGAVHMCSTPCPLLRTNFPLTDPPDLGAETCFAVWTQERHKQGGRRISRQEDENLAGRPESVQVVSSIHSWA